MKTIKLTIRPTVLGAVLSLLILAAPASAQTTGSWNVNDSGNWSDPLKWLNGTIPNGAQDTANFTFDISTTRIITNNVTGLTLGVINTGDPTGSSVYQITGTNAITLNNGASAAVIGKNAGTTGNDQVNTPLSLTGNLTVNNQGSGNLSLGGNISSTGGLKTITVTSSGSGNTSIGSGTNIISDGSGQVAVVQNSTTSKLIFGSTHNYTGGTTVVAGATLQVGAGANNGNAGIGNMALAGTLDWNRQGFRAINGVLSGAGSVIVRDAGSATYPSRLQLLSDNTFSGTIMIEDNGTSLSTLGVTYQTGAVLELGNGITPTVGDAGTADIQNNGLIDVFRSTPITISGNISGTGSLRKQTGGELTLSGVNTYTGTTDLQQGSMKLASGGQMMFDIGADGDNNQITGSGSRSFVFDGTFKLDLTDAGTGLADEWTLVTNVSDTYDTNFAVVSLLGSFTEDSGVWSRDEKGVTYQFTEASGILSVIPIPEPSTVAMLLAGLSGLALARRSRRA